MPKIKIKDTTLTIRINKEYKNDVIAAAKKKELSLSEYTEEAINKQMESDKNDKL